MKFNDTLLEIILNDLEVGDVPALMGDPGIGKSSLFRDLARRMDTEVFILECNQLADKADFTGGRLVPYERDGVTKYKQEFFPHQVIQDAIEYAEEHPFETPLLALDEINRSTSDITSAALSMPTSRTIGSSKLPKNLRMVVAGNTKGNVTTLDEASLSRFSIYNVEPDAQTLMNVVDDLNPHVVTVLSKHPHLVFARSTPSAVAMVDGGKDDDDDDAGVLMTDLMDSSEEMLQITTPRTINSVSRWLNKLDSAKLAEWLQTTVHTVDGVETNVLTEVIEAKVGRTEFAAQLVAEIAVSLNSGAAQQHVQLTAPKPGCYKQLKDASTVDELEDEISKLDDKEKSGSLLYALFERTDNRLLVTQLVQQTEEFSPKHAELVVKLAMNSQLEENNVAAMLNSGTKIGDSMKILSNLM